MDSYNLDNLNVEYINKVSNEYYQKGYYDGYTKGQTELTYALQNMSDEDLLKWKRNIIFFSNLTPEEIHNIIKGLHEMIGK